MITAILSIAGGGVMVLLIYVVWMHTPRLMKENSDALIVLGYRCDNDEVDPMLKERLETALQLLKQYSFQYVIVSGGAVASKMSEAEIMRNYFIENGVKKERILLENRSLNTVHNIVNCKIMLKEYNLQTCLLVSNSFHIRRMKYIMETLDIPASFYAKRSLTAVIKQLSLTFQEIRAYRLTKPWLEKALGMDSLQVMGHVSKQTESTSAENKKM
ncbi:uncharacterized SAM-binding protein YcdF (DUF218 family) [Scopulibacillus darangshiensis]|uniref:Uncharacterized SAM-binding protein YcdF (DUF218 family) n=1 Tax=Scopulibacillus darangshiensis TaxID=442528 RepID=A0A4R2NK71_9BACL|nr:YdcF family protein [Scopulibacillus darangshiensis]TCP21880.1 uncharacterized SAM-binding protein YcdF (DUF218 family) [Scopulibacillus darangshiensis]